MSKKLRQSIIHLIIWSIVAVGFILIFSRANTIVNWTDNRAEKIILAILFLTGFGGDAILGMAFRGKGNEVDSDERDAAVTGKAMEASYIVTLLYVFLVTISIYTKYESAGTVNVGWLWFIAYSLVIVANVSSSICTIIMYKRLGN
ncbi:hypothetical protein SAMN02745751_01801 [Dethiosulfatibacter aminovorans DSM 17477]|uniref:DUF2178 domain-containing protein n=1 Tax=Dethiosulfatibacter aminovorans DSM 17477 TaxID=1121476 RepID=A0A1M6GQV7_9FIRM|nr:hypothetical protein [Dethiosulfatibacter aminovorans]SHJ12335.1 hypothetical protein SAMN02745751_01801 [Dethiosulfatibacter aminovorans DSM 17477]